MSTKEAVSIALIDDHKLFRRGLANLIKMVDPGYHILFEADNGDDMRAKLSPNNSPDIILMDINMPGMDGYESVRWLNEHFPLIIVIVVSMIEKEDAIVKMLKLGVKGYLCKDIEPQELGEALHAVMNKGFYYTDFITGKLLHSLHSSDARPHSGVPSLNNRERDFLQFACSELTYSEIASKMYLSPKTIDGYRDSLFEKLNVRSRVGLVMYAIKHELVKI
jgi:two-component system invasion response regulator UvrY